MRIVWTGLALALLAALTAFSVRSFTLFGHRDTLPLLLATGAAWALFLLAVLLLRRLPDRAVTAVVLAGAVALGLAAVAGPPNTSTDSARYAWDGIVQDAGISPYAHVPASDALATLRPDWLFPAPAEAGSGGCDGDRITATRTVPAGDPLCTAINRPQVPTIYPPVAQAYFAVVRAAVDPGAAYWPMQLAGLLLTLGVTVMLLRGLRARGLNPRLAALWAWCPFVASEAITNSHVDVLGVALVLAASLVASRRFAGRASTGTDAAQAGTARRDRPLLTGALIGLAAAVKFVPALAAPPLARRHPVRVLLAAIVTFALVYVPYVIATGWSVVGYLPGYLSEEGYGRGTRFALVSLVVPGAGATVAAALLVLAAVALCWWRADPDRPWDAQAVLIGTVLLIVAPSTPWYALVLIPFVVLSGRWEWLAVPLGLSVWMFFPHPWVTRVAVASTIAIVIALYFWRRRGAGTHTSGAVVAPAHR